MRRSYLKYDILNYYLQQHGKSDKFKYSKQPQTREVFQGPDQNFNNRNNINIHIWYLFYFFFLNNLNFIT
jgi:hypothetical protein